MSNFLAIATVTATLSQLIRGAVRTDVPGADVTMVRPDTLQNGAAPTGVNVFLYQATPNGAWGNADVPTRRSNGEVAQRPQVALDLHYLLTFTGNEAELETQRLLGSVVRTLRARPLLTRQMIRNTIANPAFPFLSTSNLADQVELVKFAPIPLSLEELSKLWSVFFQVPYTLSVAYQGTVVLIESEEPAQQALPVLGRNVYAVPISPPLIERVEGVTGPNQPIVEGATLVITGQRLHGEITTVRMRGMDVAPADVSHDRITLPLASPPFPARALRAGAQGVQVAHQVSIGTPPTPHRGVESNVAAVVLRPTLRSITVSNVAGTGSEPRSADVTVEVAPIVGAAQRVVLSLNDVSGPAPAAYSFAAGARTSDTDTITIPISGVGAAAYVARLQVDGADSPVDLDTNSPTFGPMVTIL
jgi:hypothetical protein